MDQSQRISTSLRAVQQIVQAPGAGAAAIPDVARGDVGLLYSFDLGKLLASELVGRAIEFFALTIPASTISTKDFSFAEEHLLLNASLKVGASAAANLNSMVGLWTSQPDGAGNNLLALWDNTATATIVEPGAGVLGQYLQLASGSPYPFPVFGFKNTAYHLTASTGAGGGVTLTVACLRLQGPAGLLEHL